MFIRKRSVKESGGSKTGQRKKWHSCHEFSDSIHKLVGSPGANNGIQKVFFVIVAVFEDFLYFQDFCLCFSPKISQKCWFLFIYPARASNQQNDETNSTTMKAKRQYNIIFKVWRENNFNPNFVLCETCKHGDALPDPLQRKTCWSVAGSGLEDTLQLQSCLT